MALKLHMLLMFVPYRSPPTKERPMDLSTLTSCVIVAMLSFAAGAAIAMWRGWGGAIFIAFPHEESCARE
jgi:hypothetical protein